MRTLTLAAILAILVSGCATIHGYSVRESRGAENRLVGEVLDPLLIALDMPSLRTIATSPGCKIGFAVVRTPEVNVWISPGTGARCLYLSLFLTEGALDAPRDELMAMVAHELGHLMLQHTPQCDRAGKVSDDSWRE